MGRETALLLAAAGRPVAVWGTDGPKAQRVAEECAALGVNAIGLSVNVGDRRAVAAGVDATADVIGAIGGLVCSAAMIRLVEVDTVDFTDWDEIIRVNLTGVANAIAETLPRLRKVGRGASIVLISSTEALRALRQSPIPIAYTASKHGVVGLMRSAVVSLASEGIRINTVCAGAMATPMMDAGLPVAGEDVEQQMVASIPLGYVSHPQEVAHLVCFLLAPESSYVTGAAIPADGGMTA